MTWLVNVAAIVVPLLLLVRLSSLSLLSGWVAVEVVVVVVASMGSVNGRDVAGRRAPTGLVTWRRRGRLWV